MRRIIGKEKHFHFVEKKKRLIGVNLEEEENVKKIKSSVSFLVRSN